MTVPFGLPSGGFASDEPEIGCELFGLEIRAILVDALE